MYVYELTNVCIYVEFACIHLYIYTHILAYIYSTQHILCVHTCMTYNNYYIYTVYKVYVYMLDVARQPGMYYVLH